MQRAAWIAALLRLMRVRHPRRDVAQPLLSAAQEVLAMFPNALLIPAPIPLPLSFTLGFGPVILLLVLALLDMGAVAALRAALGARRVRQGRSVRGQVHLTPLAHSRAGAESTARRRRAA